MTYFYESLLNEYICKSVADGSLYSSKLKIFKIKFFGICLLSVRKSRVYLFNIISLFRVKYTFGIVNWIYFVLNWYFRFDKCKVFVEI